MKIELDKITITDTHPEDYDLLNSKHACLEFDNAKVVVEISKLIQALQLMEKR